jgi:1,4-alpha-glucan branching enzyme
MKKINFLILLCISSLGFSQVQNVTFNVSPTTFEETSTITITISNITTANWGISDVYLWAWSYDENDINSIDSPTNGTWANSNETQKLTNNGNGTFSITFKPTTLYNRTNIGSIGMLIKAKNGTGDKKSQDQIYQVGAFQLTLNSPTNTTSVLNSGEIFPINATTSLLANFNLKANGSSVNQKTNLTTYSFAPTITQNTNFVLEATNNGDTVSKTFSAIVKPTNLEAAVPAGMKDGINLNTSDNTKATLVFYAPGKEFIHVIGSFNNWEINNGYLLKKDSTKDRFWIEITDLTPQTDYSYQYLINGALRVADPYSTVVLTENNDQYINATTYPNLPSYPADKTNHSVTLLRTGDASYAWQNTNFQKPKKTDLVIYELLIRDFDALHSFDAVKNRLNYLQELGVNAIEFMPVNEFDGNESWGYNPSFHMALDKYYGSIASFKQLIDECHKRGIAVILDVVYNHASGQNPYYRMYNTDNGGYGGQASSDSPFFNQTAMHSYSVFNDLNHSKQATKDYIKRISQYWIDEFKIDGFRWDLTKGFTQNCTANDEGCTGSYQADRVAILKEYADNQWEKDSNFYVIFEHLGGNTEELEWVNYRLSEEKGIILWGNQNYNYRQAAAGNTSQSNFSNVSYKNRNWPVPANISYMESHDEERLMVESLTAGKATSTYNIKTLATALKRQELAGAFYFTVPGPKMIWQFGELGYDFNIDYNGRIGNKPIKWDYFEVQERKNIYDTWNKLIQLKLKYDIFETSDFTIDIANTNGLKKIQLTSTAAADIQYINIIGNFGITTQNINPVFQKTGTWYDVLNNNQTINVSNTNSLISLAPGEFKIYANTAATLSNDDLFLNDDIVVYPNPVRSSFKVNIATNNIIIYNVNGKKIKEFSGDFNANSSFSVKGIKKGFYLLKASNKEGKSYKKLIIE